MVLPGMGLIVLLAIVVQYVNGILLYRLRGAGIHAVVVEWGNLPTNDRWNEPGKEDDAAKPKQPAMVAIKVAQVCARHQGQK